MRLVTKLQAIAYIDRALARRNGAAPAPTEPRALRVVAPRAEERKPEKKTRKAKVRATTRPAASALSPEQRVRALEDEAAPEQEAEVGGGPRGPRRLDRSRPAEFIAAVMLGVSGDERDVRAAHAVATRDSRKARRAEQRAHGGEAAQAAEIDRLVLGSIRHDGGFNGPASIDLVRGGAR